MTINKSLGKAVDRVGWELRGMAESADAAATGCMPSQIDPERLARLVKTIEGEIVPRLVVSRRLKHPPEPRGMPQNEVLDELDVKEFVRLLLSHETGVAMAYVETVRQRGASLESVCLDLLAPSARELGLLWEEDECNFMQVTVGLCRLHQVLRELSPAFDADPSSEQDRGILLVPFPGDQHTFGITLVAQFLRRAGWVVCQEYPRNVDELVSLTRGMHFALVGLSVGCEVAEADVAEAIRRIRAASRNRRIGVMVGGPLFVAKPALAATVGADATAADGREAVRESERLCDAGWQRVSIGHDR